MDKLLMLDIDGTLFNPQRFGGLIRQEMIKILNIDEEELIRTNADYYANLETTTDFNPHEIVAFIAGKYGVDRAPLDNIFWGDDRIYKEAFFEDVEDSLKKLSKDNILGIFSQGTPEYQIRKLEAGGIRKYFNDEHILIKQRKLSDEAIALLPRDATVVDDNHDVATKLSSYVNSIWMNRRSEDNDGQVKTIHTLSELVS